MYSIPYLFYRISIFEKLSQIFLWLDSWLISWLIRRSSSFVLRVPPFSLLHGTNDIIVPEASSIRFSELLTSLSIRVSLYLLPKMDHTEIVTDLMGPDRHFYPTVYSCLKQEHCKLVGACWSTTHSTNTKKNLLFIMCRAFYCLHCRNTSNFYWL